VQKRPMPKAKPSQNACAGRSARLHRWN